MFRAPLDLGDDVIRLSRGVTVAYLTYRVPPQEHLAYTPPAVSVAACLVASPVMPLHTLILPPMLLAMT